MPVGCALGWEVTEHVKSRPVDLLPGRLFIDWPKARS